MMNNNCKTLLTFQCTRFQHFLSPKNVSHVHHSHMPRRPKNKYFHITGSLVRNWRCHKSELRCRDLAFYTFRPYLVLRWCRGRPFFSVFIFLSRHYFLESSLLFNLSSIYAYVFSSSFCIKILCLCFELSWIFYAGFFVELYCD